MNVPVTSQGRGRKFEANASKEGKGKYLLPFPNSLISTRSLDDCLWWLLSADIVKVVIIC